MSCRKPGALMPILVTVAALILVAYIGAYYATVRTTRWFSWKWPMELAPEYATPFGTQQADDWIGSAFSPIHGIDRQVRPHVWMETPMLPPLFGKSKQFDPYWNSSVENISPSGVATHGDNRPRSPYVP